MEDEAAPAQLVGAALRDDADEGARVAAELRRRVVRDDLELLDGFRVGYEEHLPAPRRVVDAHAVHGGVVGALTLPGGVDAHALFRDEEVGARRNPVDAGLKRGQREHIAADERQALDLFLFDDGGEVRFLRLNVW